MSSSSRSERQATRTSTGPSEVLEGSIDLVIGPMFSGKTTELIRRVRRHVSAAKKCLLVKYKRDNRYTEDPLLSTHDHTRMAAKAVSALAEIANAAWHYDVIAIDEGQFFPGEHRLEHTTFAAVPVKSIHPFADTKQWFLDLTSQQLDTQTLWSMRSSGPTVGSTSWCQHWMQLSNASHSATCWSSFLWPRMSSS